MVVAVSLGSANKENTIIKLVQAEVVVEKVLNVDEIDITSNVVEKESSTANEMVLQEEALKQVVFGIAYLLFTNAGDGDLLVVPTSFLEPSNMVPVKALLVHNGYLPIASSSSKGSIVVS